MLDVRVQNTRQESQLSPSHSYRQRGNSLVHNEEWKNLTSIGDVDVDVHEFVSIQHWICECVRVPPHNLWHGPSHA